MRKSLIALLLGACSLSPVYAQDQATPVPTANQQAEASKLKFDMFYMSGFVGIEIKVGSRTYCGKVRDKSLYEIWDSSNETLYVVSDDVGDEDMNLARSVHVTLLQQMGAEIEVLDKIEAKKEQEIFKEYLNSCRFMPSQATSSSKH